MKLDVPNIPQEFFYVFNDVKYYDEPHKYYYNDKQLTSVTTLIHKYESNFDENYWAEVKANEYGVSKEHVLFCWKFINKRATMLGSMIHDYAENLFLNKVFKYPKEEILNEFGYDPIYESFEKTKNHVHAFYDRMKGILVPIKTELVVFDKDYNIGGMVDLLFYNLKTKKFEIWDWKTNSSDKAFNDNDPNIKPLTGIFSDILSTTLNVYSLQLSTYKYIIQKYIPIELGDSFLVWISHKNEKFEIKKTNDYTDRIETMFNDYYSDKMLNL